jgi:hypothetical protein
MTIRGQNDGISGEAALAVSTAASQPAILPTLLLGELLLTCP